MFLIQQYTLLEALSAEKIESSALMFFLALGHTSSLVPLYVNSDAIHFAYGDMAIETVLTPSDREHLRQVKRIALLFQIDNLACSKPKNTSIKYYAVEFEEVGAERSQIAYAIHSTVSKFSNSLSVILFKHDEKYLLSFQINTPERKSSIILSDWFDAEDKSTEFYEGLCAYNFSSDNITDYFLDFVYAAARKYYIYPLSKEYARYDLVPTLICCADNFDNYTMEDRIEARSEAVRSILYEPIKQYGDDFIDDQFLSDYSLSDDEDVEETDFDLLEFELELIGAFEEGFANDEVDEEEIQLSSKAQRSCSAFDATTIAPEILQDPVKLLVWITERKENRVVANKADQPTNIIMPIFDGGTLIDTIKAEGIDYVDNRAKGGVLWLIGGEELIDFVASVALQGVLFTFKGRGGKATNGENAWWAK